MKRSKAFCREILLALEANESNPHEWKLLSFQGRTAEETSYHVALLAEAGFITATEGDLAAGTRWVPERLTYQGHEHLDTIRDTEIIEL